MENTKLRFLIFVLFLVLHGRAVLAYDAPADPNATPAAKSLLSYLANLPNQPNQRLISGQFDDSVNDNFIAEINSIHTMTNQWVGLIGSLTWTIFNTPIYRLGSSVPNIVDLYRKGTLIEVSGYYPNPENGSAAGTNPTMVASCSQVYTENGNQLNVSHKAHLDTMAESFLTLQNSGVVVLFRPYVEVNGNWFWWGASCSGSQFISLWQYDFNYLTKTKGLHNILWVYAPVRFIRTTVMDRYPGSSFVDIVGVSVYDYSAGGKVFNYDELVATNKPFAVTELGLQGAIPSGSGTMPPEDLYAGIQQIKANMPRAVYFMMWAGPWKMVNQINVSAAINDPWVKNRGDSNPPATLAIPKSPTGLQVF